MSLHNKAFAIGSLKGTIYDFDDAGDVLPMHTHDDATIHISIVARGRFHAHGDGWQCDFATGDVVDWQPHDPHEFVAMEPNCRLVNIFKG